MPLYEYECPRCASQRSDVRTVEQRHDGPKCDFCSTPMALVVSPVRGVVKNPAVPRGNK